MSADLRSVHREVVRARALEDVVLRLCDEQTFSGFYHPGRGQEITPVVAGVLLNRDDALFYAHRGIAYLTVKGMDPVAILGDFAGTTAGSTRGLGAGTVHCVDPELGIFGQGGTLGSCFPLATGAALAYSLRRSGQIAVAFFGDGAAARGTFLEAAVLAVARALPVVYVCENNGFAVSLSPEETQGISSIRERGAGFGMPAVSVDGYDVEAVHEALSTAFDRARSGGGPSFVETLTRRTFGHYAGDLQPYRERDDDAVADPLPALEEQLLAAGATRAELDAATDAAADEMGAALRLAQEAPLPGRDRLFEGLFA